jgi:hypothetical protein
MRKPLRIFKGINQVGRHLSDETCQTVLNYNGLYRIEAIRGGQEFGAASI